MKTIIQKNSNLIFLFISMFWIIFVFLGKRHFIETGNTIDNWFFSKGLVFYRDFESWYFPLGRFIMQPLHLLTNWDLRYDPIVGLLLGIGSLLIIYRVSLTIKNTFSTGVSLVYFSVFYWFSATGVAYYHEQLICFLLSLTLLQLLKILALKSKKIKNTSILILGLLIGTTEMAGQVASITLFVITVIILIFIIYKFTNEVFRKIGYLLVGIGLPFVPLILYVIQKNAFPDFFYSNFTYYFSSYSKYESTSFLSLPKTIGIYYLPLGVLIFFVLLYLFRHIKPNKYELVFILLGISTIPFLIYGVFHFHHLTNTLPVVALLSGLISKKLSSSLKGGKTFIFTVLLVFIILISQSILPWYFNNLRFPTNWEIANGLQKQGDGMIESLLSVTRCFIYLATVYRLLRVVTTWNICGEMLTKLKNRYQNPHHHN